MYKQKNKQLIKRLFLASNPKKGLGIVEFLFSVLIIAIVSVLIIPIAINKAPNSQNKSAQITYNQNKPLYQKAYADASRIWGQLYNEGLLKPRAGWISDQANHDNFTQFMGKFNVLKQCSYPNNSDCWAPNETSDVISGHPNATGDRCFIDSSRRSWCEAYSWGWFVVDTNGQKGPNQFGKDRFIFYTIAGNDIKASGTPDKIIFDIDYTVSEKDKCPNPPCYYRSWIVQ